PGAELRAIAVVAVDPESIDARLIDVDLTDVARRPQVIVGGNALQRYPEVGRREQATGLDVRHRRLRAQSTGEKAVAEHRAHRPGDLAGPRAQPVARPRLRRTAHLAMAEAQTVRAIAIGKSDPDRIPAGLRRIDGARWTDVLEHPGVRGG